MMIDYYKLTDDVKSGIQAQYRNNADEFARIKDENEALQKDRERLEWLVTTGCKVVGIGGLTTVNWEVSEMVGNFALGGPCDTWRDAIDEAKGGE
jgi:hypothetical protein